MKNLYLLILVLIIGCRFSSYAQESVNFIGFIGNQKDTFVYYFDNHKDNSIIIPVDKNGNYSLEIKFKNKKTITFSNINSNTCPQTLDLKKIRKYITRIKSADIQNDLFLISGFACIREELYIPHEWAKFRGDWINSKNEKLQISGCYIRELDRNGIKYVEEGKWAVMDDKLQLESIYVTNVEINTLESSHTNLVFDYEKEKLIPEQDNIIEYVKK